MENKKTGQYTWRYCESCIVTAVLVCAGIALQLMAGSFNYALFRAPVNILFGGFTVILAAAVSTFKQKRFFLWLSGIHLPVTLTGTLIILGIVMGLVPQTPSAHGQTEVGLLQMLGFTDITSSWPFILIYAALLVSLAALNIRRLRNFRRNDYGFYLNHTGVWLLLFAAGLGSADKQTCVMKLFEGTSAHSAQNGNKQVELPFTVTLIDFVLNEYLPRLAIVDHQTGNFMPQGSPSFFHLSEKQTTIGNWEITLNEYMPQAVRITDSLYRVAAMPASVQAAFITVRNIVTEVQHSGWVSAGNIAQMQTSIDAGSGCRLVMLPAEPKQFISSIEVNTDGHKTEALLMVNKPFRAGSWTIYQSGYDVRAGKLSGYTTLQLVYDPWIIPVYAGIILLAAGSVCMFWTGSRRKKQSSINL